MSTLAAIRPDSWDFPLFLHVLGAMLLVGATLTGASALAYARGDARFLRLGYWTLLAVGLPGFVLMRLSAEWIFSKEGWDDLPESVDEPTWIGIGRMVGDLGGIVFLVSLVIGGIGVYQLRAGKGSGLLRVTLALSLVLLAAYLVAVWAMSGKPG